MKKTLKKREDEPIYKWLERLSAAYNLTDEQIEMVGEVSKTSYIAGSDNATELFKKYNK